MLLSIAAVVAGLALLVWSADRFVEGAAAAADHAGMPPLLIGMVVVGFGTSAPELTVSVISALEGSPALALGNAFGSNIANIGLILGLTALISPIRVHSRVLKRELPILTGVTLLAIGLLWGGELSRLDAAVLLAVFAGLMAWTIRQGIKQRDDHLAVDVAQETSAKGASLGWSLFWLAAGLVLLIVSSRVLVWGAVDVARALGVGELVIGLTIVAVGTSLPELASSLAAARKGEHDLALGNVVGSNLFNTLGVVGLAGVVDPFSFAGEVVFRDGAVMLALTLVLSLFGWRFGGLGRSPTCSWATTSPIRGTCRAIPSTAMRCGRGGSTS